MFAFLVVVALLSSACSIRMPRARRLALLASAALFLYVWLPGALVVARLWESGYAAELPTNTGIGAIVVLAGGVHGPVAPVDEPFLGRATYERSVYAAQLYQHWRTLPVVVSGGNPDPGGRPYSDAMRRELIRRGVPAAEVWMETRSRTTYENAKYTAELLRSHRVTTIALVTSASHMRRAAASFRNQGVRVLTAPCAFHSMYTLAAADWLVPNSTAISWNDEIVHELVGMIWYRLRGRI
jgi:uncharacterized SAM-binding protein YcdF (DUF218 family)